MMDVISVKDFQRVLLFYFTNTTFYLSRIQLSQRSSQSLDPSLAEQCSLSQAHSWIVEICNWLPWAMLPVRC